MSVEGKIETSEAVQLAATKRRAQIGTLLSLTLLALLALMWVVLAFSTKSFWTYNNITNLLRQGAMIAILSLGETFVIITAGIDLSVGAVVGFTSVIIALLLTNGVRDLGGDHHHAGSRLRHWRFPRLRNQPPRIAAFHHDAGNADGFARRWPTHD